MKQIARQMALVSLITVLLILIAGTTAEAAKPKARLNYISQTPKSINVVYMNMPATSQTLYVNKASREKFPRYSLLILLKAMEC